jgi:hypothetical protein
MGPPVFLTWQDMGRPPPPTAPTATTTTVAQPLATEAAFDASDRHVNFALEAELMSERLKRTSTWLADVPPDAGDMNFRGPFASPPSSWDASKSSYMLFGESEL